MSPKMRRPIPRVGDGEIRIRVPNAGGAPEEETPETAESEALEEALSQLPQGSVAKLYRLEEDGTKAYVGQSAPEGMTEERIARAGPGKYRVIYWGPLKDHPGKKGYVAGRTVTISAGSRGLGGPVSNADGTPVLDPMAAMMQAQMIGMMESMGKQRQIELSLMERLVNRPEAKSMDWAPILAILAPVLGTLMQTMLQRKDPIELAAEIQKLAPVNTVKDPLEQLKAMIAVVKDLTGKGDDEERGSGERGPWWEGPLERIATALIQHQQSSGGGAVVGAEEVPVVTAAAAAKQVGAGGAVVNLESIIASHGPTLVQWAAQGRDPTWAAETLLYEVPDFYHAVIAKRIQEEPGLVNAIIAGSPAFGPYREWVEALRDALLELIVGEEEDEPTASAKLDTPAPKETGARTVKRNKGPNDAAT